MSGKVIDFKGAQRLRLLEELGNLPPYGGPVIDCRGKKMKYGLSAFGGENDAQISIMCFDCSDGIARDIGVIRFQFHQWKEFRNEIDRIVDFHEKQLKK